MEKFKPGQIVKRIQGHYCGMDVGDYGMIHSVEKSGVIIKEYGFDRKSLHAPESLEIIYDPQNHLVTKVKTGVLVDEDLWDSIVQYIDDTRVNAKDMLASWQDINEKINE